MMRFFQWQCRQVHPVGLGNLSLGPFPSALSSTTWNLNAGLYLVPLVFILHLLEWNLARLNS